MERKTTTMPRGKKARLRFTPLEIAYQKKYGIMPDYHADRLREELHDPDKASAMVQRNMDGIWIDGRIRHAIEERDRNNGGFTYAYDTLF